MFLSRLSRKRSTWAALPVLMCLFISQFFWAPRLMAAAPNTHSGGTAMHPADGVMTDRFLHKEGAIVGPKGAAVDIIEFSDFQCGACRVGHAVMIQLLRRYAGRLRFQHRDYPLDQACNRKIDRPFHKQACQAAAYAKCADKQGRFWPFIRRLFDNQHHLEHPTINRFVKAVGLDAKKMALCVKSAETRAAILRDVEEAIRRKVRGTPSYFINGEEVLGPRKVTWWVEKIDRILKNKPVHSITKVKPK